MNPINTTTAALIFQLPKYIKVTSTIIYFVSLITLWVFVNKYAAIGIALMFAAHELRSHNLLLKYLPILRGGNDGLI